MGVFVICKACNADLYSADPKEEIRFPYRFRCHVCGNVGGYSDTEVQEERYDLACAHCSGKFHMHRSLPRRVRCPHCQSSLHISGDARVAVLSPGSNPATTRQKTVGGEARGMVIGALIGGPMGAILGGIIGGILGSTQDSLECEYLT